jgi:hypothetical protein
LAKLAKASYDDCRIIYITKLEKNKNKIKGKKNPLVMEF